MQISSRSISAKTFSLVGVLQALVLFATFVSASAEAQTELSKAEAQAHLVKSVEAVYPAFARAAGVDGVVRVRVGIGPNGRVSALMGSSGPASLFKAAEDTVLRYVYKPFLVNGLAAYVQTTIDVPFKLRAHKRIPAPPHLTREDFWGSNYRHPLTEFPPELRRWLASHLPSDREQVCDSSDNSCSLNSSTAADDELLKQVDVFDIPASGTSGHLYLVTWHQECGGTGNCTEELLEENATGVRAILATIGSGYYVHQHPDSRYPDIFIASHASGSEVGIAGFVRAGGEWGQLYCGEIVINDDQSERDHVRVCD